MTTLYEKRLNQPAEPSGSQNLFGDFAPALVGFTDDVLFGQVWLRAMAAMAVAKDVFSN